FTVIDPQSADPANELLDRERPIADRYMRSEVDEGVAGGTALSVPGPSPADRELDLDRRLEPVDIRALEQADLDESHGSARITLRSCRDRHVSGHRPRPAGPRSRNLHWLDGDAGGTGCGDRGR